MIKYDVYKFGRAIYRIPNNGDQMKYYSVLRRWEPAVIATPWGVKSRGKLLARNVVFKDSVC